MRPALSRTLRSLQSNILAGILTVGPLLVTYLIFRFLFNTLADAGLPLVKLYEANFPTSWLTTPWKQSVLAILLTLLLLYVAGRVTSLVIGRQAFNFFEAALERLPFVARVYTSVRQLLDTMMAKKDSSQRVVLVDFYSGAKEYRVSYPDNDRLEHRRSAPAVLLPNAINPTSAFLQILPIERVIETN